MERLEEKLAASEARVRALEEALKGLLAAPTWADQWPEDMDEEDRAAERIARAALGASNG